MIHDDDHESNIFRRNKEGICSLIGYCGLFCMGSLISQLLKQSAQYCHAQTQKPGKAPNRWGPKKRLILWWLSIAAFVALLFAAMHLCCAWIEPVSRRACNLSYVLWMVAYHTCQCFWKISLQVRSNRRIFNNVCFPV